METTYYSEIEDTTTLADGLVASGIGGVSEIFSQFSSNPTTAYF